MARPDATADTLHGSALDALSRTAAAPDAVGLDPTPAGRIGRYRVLERLGEGAMGAVYSAYDETLDRRVAIKVLKQFAAPGTGETSLRMRREAQALARLNHPNVAQVFEVSEADGQTFVVMEYIAGQTLRAWLGEGTHTWREVVATFLQAGRGLAAAHAVRLVHRDFKPDNVLVGVDGRARVVDFGLARSFGGSPATATAAADPSVAGGDSSTRTGAVVGTPRYMSPEQHEGREVTDRGDQFGFCVALWEALYGGPPFVGATLIELRRRVTTGQREAPPLGSEVPTSVLAILDRGLARESDARWPTMDVLLEALASDREFIGDPELDLTVARRPRLLLGLGFSAVAVINAGVMIWLDLRREQPPTTAEALSAGAMGVAITCGLLVLARRRVLKNAINRRLVFFGLVLTIAPFLNRCLGHLFAAPLTHVLTTDMLLAVALCAVGGAVMVRWLWYVGLAFAAGIVATVALPAAVQSILAISQCAAWVLAVGFFLAVSPVAVPPATPRRADPTSRSSASSG